MSKLFLGVLSSLFFLFQTVSFANEETEEPQEVVSDDDEVSEVKVSEDAETPEEVPQEEASDEALAEKAELAEAEDQNKALEVPDEVQENDSETEALSEEEKEANRAEEAELREYGAGEEPLVEE